MSFYSLTCRHHLRICKIISLIFRHVRRNSWTASFRQQIERPKCWRFEWCELNGAAFEGVDHIQQSPAMRGQISDKTTCSYRKIWKYIFAWFWTAFSISTRTSLIGICPEHPRTWFQIFWIYSDNFRYTFKRCSLLFYFLHVYLPLIFDKTYDKAKLKGRVESLRMVQATAGRLRKNWEMKWSTSTCRMVILILHGVCSAMVNCWYMLDDAGATQVVSFVGTKVFKWTVLFRAGEMPDVMMYLKYTPAVVPNRWRTFVISCDFGRPFQVIS